MWLGHSVQAIELSSGSAQMYREWSKSLDEAIQEEDYATAAELKKTMDEISAEDTVNTFIQASLYWGLYKRWHLRLQLGKGAKLNHNFPIFLGLLTTCAHSQGIIQLCMVAHHARVWAYHTLSKGNNVYVYLTLNATCWHCLWLQDYRLAIDEENFDKAAELLQGCSIDLCGWWSVNTPDAEVGNHVLRISKAFNRYKFDAFSPEVLADLHVSPFQLRDLHLSIFCNWEFLDVIAFHIMLKQ